MPKTRTEYFHELTPDRIQEAFAMAGIDAQPAVRFLNSMENRVAQISDGDEERWVAKFYRPGRWSREAIREEHEFLRELYDADLRVVPPLRLKGVKDCIGTVAGIYFAVFPYAHGRTPDELEMSHVRILGAMLARVHDVGARHAAPHRRKVTPESWALGNLEQIRREGAMPEVVWMRYERAVKRLVQMIEPLFRGVESIRLHGDCHRGNLLWSSEGPTLVDFDDMSMGPPVQDVWMLISGRDSDAVVLRNALVEAYERIRPFDRRTMRLIEPLRALRYVNYAAWLIHRKDDPNVKRVFHDVGTPQYWRAELEDLETQLEVIQEELYG